jgi:hypothetical protein
MDIRRTRIISADHGGRAVWGSNAGIVGSNPISGMYVCVRLFCVCAVLCVGSGLAMGYHSSKSPTVCVKNITKLKKRAQQRAVQPLMNEWMDNRYKQNVTNLWIEVYTMTPMFINVFYSNATGGNMNVVSEKICRFYTLKRKSKTKKTSNLQVHIQTRNKIPFVFKNQFHMKFSFWLSKH